jgi:hypothetical protein
MISYHGFRTKLNIWVKILIKDPNSAIAKYYMSFRLNVT